MPQIEIECYTPHANGLKAHANEAECIYVGGPVGSGKSRWAIEEIQKHFINNQNALFFVVRENYTDLVDSTIPDFFKLWNPWLFRYPNDEKKSWNGSDHILKVVNNGEVRFRSADRPRRFQSIDQMSGFWFEEMPDVSEDTFLYMYTRPRRKDISLKRMGTGYVPDNKNWVFHYFWELNDPRYQKVIFTQTDNKKNVVDGYYENLYSLYRSRPDWIKRYLEAEPVFITKGDPLFPGFDRRLYSVPDLLEPIKNKPIIRGWDYGYDWSAVVLAQVNPIDQLEILGTSIGHNITVEEYVPKMQQILLDWFGNVQYEDFGPHDGEYKSPHSLYTIHEKLKSRGINPRVRQSYPGSVEDGLNAIRRLLIVRDDGRPGIVISDPRNGTLLDGFAGACCKDTSGKPDKTCRPHIDVMDALRCLVTGVFDTLPENNPSGKRDSLDQRQTQVAEMWS